MDPKFLCATAAVLVVGGGSICFAGEDPDVSIPPVFGGAALGAPPGNEGKTVDPLRWLTPQGGETFCLDGAYPLMWTGGGDDLVQFLLIRMDIWTVVPGAPAGDFDNDGRETWTIPDYVNPGDYEMYVQREDRTDWRYSATFAVKDCGCPVKGGRVKRSETRRPLTPRERWRVSLRSTHPTVRTQSSAPFVLAQELGISSVDPRGTGRARARLG